MEPVEKTEITVQACEPSGEKNRTYTKWQFCFCCDQHFSRLDKHLPRKHDDAEEVAELLQHKKGSLERRDILRDLTRLGNFNHNLRVLKEKKGEIVVVRRPKVGTSADYRRYVPCHACLGFFHKEDLWRHNCPKLASDHNFDTKMALRKGKALLFSSMDNNVSPVLLDMLSKMRKKDLADAIAGDQLICKYARWLLMKHSTNTDQSKYICNKLRELARLLLAVRKHKDDEEIQLTDDMKPQFFDTLIDVVKQMPKEGPSTDKRLGESLQKVVVVLKGQYMSEGNSKGRRDADKFEWQMTKMWPDLVSIPAQRELNFKKQSKPCSIPFSEDVQKMAENLKNKIKEVHQKAEDGDRSCLRFLLELCLARIITFNKRRSGEVSKLPLKFYKDHVERANDPQVIEDLDKALDPVERQLCNTMFLIRGRGKRGR